MSRKRTQEEFIEISRAIHGDRYDYSKSVYVNAPSKLIITCREHGDFLQSPNKHFSGQGCVLCGRQSLSKSKTIPAETFVRMAREKHGEIFKYDTSKYDGLWSEVRIACPNHGWFSMEASGHIKSDTGCRRCGQLKTGRANSYGTDEFIRRAKSKHGDRYEYKNAQYVNSKKAISITCKDHGDFIQIPANHIYGSGCPSCAKTGFSPDMPSTLYVLKSHCGSMVKVGITRNLAQRLSQLKKRTPFKFDLMHTIDGSGEIILGLERTYHGMMMSCELSGFNGSNEWFRYDQDIIERIKKGA